MGVIKVCWESRHHLARGLIEYEVNVDASSGVVEVFGHIMNSQGESAKVTRCPRGGKGLGEGSPASNSARQGVSQVEMERRCKIELSCGILRRTRSASEVLDILPLIFLLNRASPLTRY